jgi:hypothetical protein
MQILISCIVKSTETNFLLLRSKIHELHPVHRASLEALLRHLLRVASHSDHNRMTVNTLSSQLCKYVLGYDTTLTGDIDMKARCVDLLNVF